jgi:hypothetical protein
MNRCCLFLLFTALLFAVACGGNGSTPGGGGGTHDATITSGNWYIVATSTAVAGQKSYVGGNLTQSGTTISGTMHVDNSSCYDLLTDVPMTGTISGSNVNLTSSSVNSQVIAVKGTVGTNTITGTYTITGGCSDGDKGSVSAMFVPSITGTWKATETSGSTTVTTTATVTQGATATTDGIFPLSGTLNVTNPVCFTSATIDQTQSFMAGDIVAVYATTNDVGGGTGTFIYVAYLDNPGVAKSFSGMYQFESGVCSGTSGNLNFTKQ